MKITHVEFNNFSFFYASMGLTKVSIDFTKSLNKLILLLGANGSGKTSILSLLHPFSGVGTLDSRSGTDLILDKKDGKKIIHYDFNNCKYIITHHYQHQKKGRKISSYITKNGLELNPNGNVTSFLEIVEQELHIDQNFLKIIRLGPNVADLITRTSSERKDFLSKLLSELDVYKKIHTKISEDCKEKRILLRNIADKIKHLNIEDINVAKEDYEKKKKLLENIRKDKENIIQEMYTYKGKVESQIKDIDSFEENIRKIKNTIDKVFSDINKLEDIKPKDILVITNENFIKNIQDENILLNESIMSITDDIYDIKHKIENIKTEKIDLINKVELFNSAELSSQIEESLTKYREIFNTLDKTFKEFKPKFTKADILQDMSIMQNIDTHIMNTFEVSKKAVERFKEDFTNVSNLPKLRDNYMNKLRKLSSVLDENCELINKEQMKKQKMLATAFNCSSFKQCDYYNLIVKELNKPKTDSNSKKDYDVYNDCLSILGSIDMIKSILSIRNSINLPYEINLVNIIADIMNRNISYYSEEKIQQFIMMIEKYDEYMQAFTNIEKLELELKLSKASINGLDKKELKENIDRLNKEESELNTKLNKLLTDKEKWVNKLNKNDKLINIYFQTKEYNSKKEPLVNELKRLNDEFHNYIILKNTYDEYIEKKASYNNKISNTESSIVNIENELRVLSFNMMEYEKLTKGKKELDDEFEILEQIKYSVSTATGIPLIYLKVNLRNTQMIANKLIKEVFKDELELADFDINEKEFRMPYIKNGLLINDVSSASQGERSIISMALSFAILEQFTNHYNILLLDEVDGPLSVENKQKFLYLLDKQISKIGCEQVFLISHNNLFENYPVDAILTSRLDMSGFKSVNVLFEA